MFLLNIFNKNREGKNCIFEFTKQKRKNRQYSKK
jgi:hypothetical protein